MVGEVKRKLWPIWPASVSVKLYYLVSDIVILGAYASV
jgi:hypothetical protein